MQPTAPTDPTDPTDPLVADSRERAVRALLRVPPLRRLWGAQLTSGTADALATLVLVLLGLQAAVFADSFGGGYRGAAIAITSVFAVRLLATLLFGAVLLGPLTSLTAADGPLDRRWTMISADIFRAGALIVAPLWIDWTPDAAFGAILITVFVAGVAERLWMVAKDGAAPALLPAPPPEGAAVRPLPDRMDALRRLSLRTTYVALPLGAAALALMMVIARLLGAGVAWFDTHPAALGSYLAAGLFAASVSVLYVIELPDGGSGRARSPLEGLRRPRIGPAEGPERGRTGAVSLLVVTCAAVSGAIAVSVAVAVLQAEETYTVHGPVAFALLVFAITAGPAIGIRWAPRLLPAFSRRRLLALATAVCGLALLGVGLIADASTGLLLALFAGIAAGIAANTAHALLEQETEEARRPRLIEHLHAVVRVAIAVGAIFAPLLAAAIGQHRLELGDLAFAHGGSAFTYMLTGALLLVVAALVLVRTDDRKGVSLRRDLLEALRGGGEPVEAAAGSGFFIAVEGGDGAGKSTQVEALAQWMRDKGHEVVVTREPGATSIGQRLRSILLDVASAGISHRAEALLYAADRAEHVDSVVRPALERGSVVLSDRYIDSSVAYQGAGRELSPTEIARINRWATGGLVPNLTVLLDVSPEAARERFTEAPDRLESEPAAFHQRVRAGFLALAVADPARYLVVDAGQEAEVVTTTLRHRLDHVLPLSAAELRAQEEARKAAEEEARRRAEEEAARKAEEERQERERQEQLARLHAEEEERKRREIQEARRIEAEREAEVARLAAEEARRRAEEERRRREAEEQAYRAEQERLRVLAEEQSRLRAEAEERRVEKQRRAEEALLRAEQARLAAEGASDSEITQTLPTPEPQDAPPRDAEPMDAPPRAADGPQDAVPPWSSPDAEETSVLPQARHATDQDEDDTRVMPQVPDPDAQETQKVPTLDDPTKYRRRPDWAEETPLDDLPSLADELLGSQDERDDGKGPRGR